MQLILETETSNIDIKDKMSTLEQESLGEKLMTNGNAIEAPGGVVPNSNKENILVKENIIDSCKESVNLNQDNDKQAQETSSPPTETGDASAVQTIEKSTSNIVSVAEENKEKEQVPRNGEDKKESQIDIVSKAEINAVDQESILIKTKHEDTLPTEKNDANDIDKKKDDCLDIELPPMAKEAENNHSDQHNNMKTESIEIAKIEQEVNNKVNENISQEDQKCTSSTMRKSDEEFNSGEYVSEPEVVSVNTKFLENSFATKKENESNSVKNIREVNAVNFESLAINKNADENSSITLAEKDSDSEQMKSELEVNSVNTESLKNIKNTDVNCSSTIKPTLNQTEVSEVQNNQDTQLENAPIEIIETLLDCGEQTKTAVFESNQDTLSNNDAVEKIRNEFNNDSQNLMECDEPVIVTCIDDKKTETFIDCEKAETSMDFDKTKTSINCDMAETSMHCNKAEISIICDKGEKSIDFDKADTSMDCDNVEKTKEGACDKAETSIVCDNAEMSMDCDKEDTFVNCDNEEKSINCANSEISMECDKDKKTIEGACPKADTSTINEAETYIECDKAEVHINFVNAEPSMNCDNVDTIMHCDKAEVLINCEKADTSLICDKAETSIDCDKAEIPINCDKVDTTIYCDKAQTFINCDKAETSINCEKTETSIDSDKAEKTIGGATNDVISEQKSAEYNVMLNTIAKVKEIEKEVDCLTADSIISVSGNVGDRVSDEDNVCTNSNKGANSSDSNNEIPDVTSNDVTGKTECANKIDVLDTPVTDSTDIILDEDELKVISDKKEEPTKKPEESAQEEKSIKENKKSTISKLSNTLNILSDDEDEPTLEKECPNNRSQSNDKQCINIEDDDDIMLIDEDTPSTTVICDEGTSPKAEDKADNEPIAENSTIKPNDAKESERSIDSVTINEKELSTPEKDIPETITKPDINEKQDKTIVDNLDKPKPLLAENLFNTYKKNFAHMTRDDLEEFCILKIVESIIDRSNLTEIRSKIKNMAQNMEQYKKKSELLTKQNRDLQVVLKSVQEEQKKAGDSLIMPLKITRSVGMQVLMTDKNARKKVTVSGMNVTTNNNSNNRQTRNTANQSPRQQPQQNISQPIPVPRLVPATSTNNVIINKSNTSPQVNSPKKSGKNSTPQNGMRVPPAAPKSGEKRAHNKMLTVDLTDDEPPAKVPAKATPAPPVRLVNPQNLLAPRQPTSQPANHPRKVYIPIGGPQGQSVRPGQTIMLKSVPPPGPRPRAPMAPMVRLPQNAMRMTRVQGIRHPAPLPDPMKQYQPPNWKALPPAPDLKLSKVENGIVISWKIEGYDEDSYEVIASYQLYAYQETSSPPSTNLWKKIGDVKALPLPMACTLTQFMAGYKYYFAVRAVDIRSRLGPFSLPGSILLLNKM